MLPRSTIMPTNHALQLLTDASKEGWGAHLNDHTTSGTKPHINYLELKAVFLALKESQDLCQNNVVLIATDNTTVVAYINKEGGGGGDEVGPSVCPPVENPHLLYQQTGHSQSLTHSRPTECGSRQTIQTRPGNSNRVISFQRSSRQCATGGTNLK